MACEFLLAFHSNYGAISYRLRDIASYGRKLRNFYTPPVFSASQGLTHRNFAKIFDTRYRVVMNLWQYVKPFPWDTRT